MYRVLGADGKEYGPVTAEQVRRWIADRRLNANSLVQPEGMTGWKPLSTFLEFAPTLAGSAPIAPLTPQTLHTGSQNPLAVTGIVCSSLGLLCCGCMPLGVLGVVFSIVALSQIKQHPEQGGKQLAIAGIIIGAVSLIESAIIFISGAIGGLVDKFK